VVKRNKPPVPSRPPVPPVNRGILELERFDSATLAQWSALSRELDLLQAELYFGLEPQRREKRADLVHALQRKQPIALPFQGWCRIVPYRFSLAPLSCAGSLQAIGGRFNAGAELDANTMNPWPALYLAENYETAFREKFQLASTSLEGGLRPEELALEHGASHATVMVQGRMSRVFDMSEHAALHGVAQVLGRIKMSARARELKRKLKIADRDLFMLHSGKQLHQTILEHNWRLLPIQFGLPAPSQVLADLLREAGFEAILYKSSKGPGKCLAVFPDLLDEASFVELTDVAPQGVEHRRLDWTSAAQLEGWEVLPRRQRRG
jgi:hypothetical protein